jgi:uncharacterized protein (DUF302 family)
MTIFASDHGPDQTAQKLTAAVTARGMTILAEIDHALAASKAGMSLGPTKVLIFGNPKAGTPLMQAAQTLGIDLPLKALVWQDANGETWVGYNDPAWLAARHGLNAGHDALLDQMRAALDAVARDATQ